MKTKKANTKKSKSITNQKNQKTMSTIKINDLKKAGKELNTLLFEDDPQIDIKADAETLKEQLLEAIALLEEGEADELSEVTQNVIAELSQPEDEDDDETPLLRVKGSKEVATPSPKGKSKKEPEPEPEADDLAEAVADCDDLDELKAMVKENDEFINLRKGIGIQKNADKLKARMLECLDVETISIKEKAPEAKKPAAKKEKAPKAKKETKKKRIDYICDALKAIKKVTSVEEVAEAANDAAIAGGFEDNPTQTLHHLKVVLPALIIMGVIESDDKGISLA